MSNDQTLLMATRNPSPFRRKKGPTIAEVAFRVMADANTPCLRPYDTDLLDRIAREAAVDVDFHPIDRRAAVLKALADRPDLFEKNYQETIDPLGRDRRMRCFWLKRAFLSAKSA